MHYVMKSLKSIVKNNNSTEALQNAMSEFINPENADTFGDFVRHVKELKVYHDDHISDFFNTWTF